MEKINRESFEKMTTGHDKEKQEFIDKAHEEALKENAAIDESKVVSGESKSVSKEDSESITIEEAERLLGEDFFGPKMIEKVFGHTLETIPNIPFSKAELERAKELGQQLILQNDVMNVRNPQTGEMEQDVPIVPNNLVKYFPRAHDGKPLAYDYYGSGGPPHISGDVFKEERPRVGWRLTSKETIPDATGKTYVGQTEVLIDYLQKQVFKDMKLPREYEDAISEFNRAKTEDNLAGVYGDDGRKLAALEITQLTRERVVEVLYRLILNSQGTKRRLLEFTSTWTATLDNAFRPVSVGSFDEWGGMDFLSHFPALTMNGVSFSRGAPSNIDNPLEHPVS